MFEFCNRLLLAGPLCYSGPLTLLWTASLFRFLTKILHFSLLIFLFYLVLPLEGELERVYLLTFLVLTVGPPDEDLLFPPLLLTLPPFWAPAFPLSFTIVRTQRKPI